MKKQRESVRALRVRPERGAGATLEPVARLRPAQLLNMLMDSAPAYIFFKDAAGRFLRINRALATVYGLKDPAEAIGKTDADFYSKAAARGFAEDERRILRSGKPLIAHEERGLYADGRVLWHSVTKMPVRGPGGTLVGILGISYDITSQKGAENTVREQANLLQTLMENVPDSIYFKDMQSRFKHVSRGTLARFGLADAREVIGKTDADYFTPEHANAALRDEQAVMRTGKPIVAKGEKETFPDGAVGWASTTKLPWRDAKGRLVGTFGISRDITDVKRAEERLAYQAFYDPLTGLANRALFMNRLAHLFKGAKRRGSLPFAVLYLDLDRFKGVNDSLGHHAGDALLVSVARRLEQCMRPGDTVARIGGDEFALLLDQLEDDGVPVRVAERVLKAVAKPINLDGTVIFTTTSIGIAINSDAYREPEDVLRDADTAMYRAKGQGNGRCEIFDPGMHERAVTMLRMEGELRRALEKGEMEVFYQPLLSLEDRTVLGFEALVRWRHPQRGLLAPQEFLAVAEETGLIVPLGYSVLREACRRTAEWQRRFPSKPPLSVSVNLSSRQILHDELVEKLGQILSETGLDPKSLTLEITENTILPDLPAVSATLTRLRQLSVRLRIDDFGTSYSTLGHIRDMKVDALKMNRAFVQALGQSTEQSEIVRTIVALAQNLGLNVTAAGVETPKQFKHVRELKCTAVQGFLFSRPMDARTAERFLAKRGQARMKNAGDRSDSEPRA